MRAKPWPSFPAAAGLVLLAGCLAAQPVLRGASLASDAAAAIGEPIQQTHDHGDPSLHTASYGVQLLSHSFGTADGAPPPAGSGYTELAWKDGWVYECRDGSLGGFIVYDVHNPRNLTPVGSLNGLGCYDIKANKDNSLVFWAQQRHAPEETADLAKGSDYAPRGLFITDVRDKAHPKDVGFFPVPPNGVHTVNYLCMEPATAPATGPCAGREILFLQTYDLTGTPLGWGQLSTAGGLLAPEADVNPATQRVIVTELVRNATPDGRMSLRQLSVIQDHDIAPPGKGYFPHDSWSERSPSGDFLLYISYWDAGVFVYNVDDPANPRQVAHYTDFGPSPEANIHFSMATDLHGRHILVTEPELPTAPDTGQLTVVDASDPAHLQKLGYWSLPGHLVVDSPFRFSPHNFNLANGRIYLAHYHAGVWVVNMSDPTNPEAAGFYQPHVARPGYTGDIPSVWSAFYYDGVIWASDEGTGLYALHYDGDPAPTILAPAANSALDREAPGAAFAASVPGGFGSATP